jgi:FtsP/CotA-like multicopper oxidase with cupredoxin domain
MSEKVDSKVVISRRDMLKRTGAMSVGLLAAVQSGCGSTNEEIFVNTNGNGNPGPNPTPTPDPGGGLTFQFVKPQAATVPAGTTSFDFEYFASSNNEIGSENRAFAQSITVFPPVGTVIVRITALDANGFPLLELEGSVTLPGQGQTTVVNLGAFESTTVTFTSLSVTPPEFDLATVDATQQLALSAGFSNGENLAFSATLLDEAVYVSDDESSATVSDTGLVTAVAAGNPTITISFTDSNNVTRSDTVLVNVTIAPPGPVIPPVDFVQPPVRRSVDGFLSVLMQIDFTTNVIENLPAVGQSVTFSSRTINGTLAPPTIRIKPGDHLEIPIQNLLPADNDPNSPTWQGPAVDPTNENIPHEWNTINMHTHGFHVSPSQDNVLLQILPGNSYVYKYDLPSDHPAGTLWYHPHKHGGTAMHLFSGMAGAIIVEGDIDQVPEIAAAADLVFNINELVLKSSPVSGMGTGFGTDPDLAEYFVPNNSGPGSYQTDDSVYVVNGQYQPRMTVRPGQLIRLRMLNASARGAAPLTITGATNNWNIISFDGLTLPEMLADVPEFTLQPANRADVLLRFDTPGTGFTITKEAFAPGGGNPAAVIPAQVLAFIDVVGDPFPQNFPSGPLPVSPTLPDITEDELNQPLRTLTYQTGPFRINGVQFSSSVINQIIPLGSVLEWSLVNSTAIAHPHHIHIQEFQVVATSDGLLNGIQFSDANDPTDPVNITNYFPKPVWMDTVAIPAMGWVRVRQRFPDFPGLFVLHCHILTHEDQGMMQTVFVN